MSFPTPLITGTVVYAAIAGFLLFLVTGALLSGAMSKDNASIGFVVITISFFSMWLFWLCAWLHQWHPLISPIYEE